MSQSELIAVADSLVTNYNKLENVSQSEHSLQFYAPPKNYNKLENVSQSEQNGYAFYVNDDYNKLENVSQSERTMSPPF